MPVATISWRPRAFGLAAAVLFAAAGAAPALAQGGALAEKLQLCGACHGEDGNSKMEKIPSLAGQPAFYMLNQLFLMREGVRKVEAMAPIVKDLKDGDLTALSEHYARLAPKRSDEPLDPELAKRGQEIAAGSAAAPAICRRSPDRSRCRGWPSSGSTICSRR